MMNLKRFANVFCKKEVRSIKLARLYASNLPSNSLIRLEAENPPAVSLFDSAATRGIPTKDYDLTSLENDVAVEKVLQNFGKITNEEIADLSNARRIFAWYAREPQPITAKQHLSLLNFVRLCIEHACFERIMIGYGSSNVTVTDLLASNHKFFSDALLTSHFLRPHDAIGLLNTFCLLSLMQCKGGGADCNTKIGNNCFPAPQRYWSKLIAQLNANFDVLSHANMARLALLLQDHYTDLPNNYNNDDVIADTIDAETTNLSLEFQLLRSNLIVHIREFLVDSLTPPLTFASLPSSSRLLPANHSSHAQTVAPLVKLPISSVPMLQMLASSAGSAAQLTRKQKVVAAAMLEHHIEAAHRTFFYANLCARALLNSGVYSARLLSQLVNALRFHPHHAFHSRELRDKEEEDIVLPCGLFELIDHFFFVLQILINEDYGELQFAEQHLQVCAAVIRRVALTNTNQSAVAAGMRRRKRGAAGLPKRAARRGEQHVFSLPQLYVDRAHFLEALIGLHRSDNIQTQRHDQQLDVLESLCKIGRIPAEWQFYFVFKHRKTTAISSKQLPSFKQSSSSSTSSSQSSSDHYLPKTVIAQCATEFHAKFANHQSLYIDRVKNRALSISNFMRVCLERERKLKYQIDHEEEVEFRVEPLHIDANSCVLDILIDKKKKNDKKFSPFCGFLVKLGRDEIFPAPFSEYFQEIQKCFDFPIYQINFSEWIRLPNKENVKDEINNIKNDEKIDRLANSSSSTHKLSYLIEKLRNAGVSIR